MCDDRGERVCVMTLHSYLMTYVQGEGRCVGARA